MKKVYISFLLHGNMCYDRYTKQEIREKFPVIYATGVRAMHEFPEVTAHIDFPGLTTLSLRHHASWFMDELKPLIERRQVVMAGCQYAANHAMCSDEESDLVAGRVSMQIMRDELQRDVSTFISQELAFHPQSPFIMNQIGAKRLIIRPEGWPRPRRVRGIDGSEVIVYPLDTMCQSAEELEELYDNHADGDFVLIGGDFEMLGNVAAYVEKIEDLASKGKILEWTTVDEYEAKVGVTDTCDAPNPFGHAFHDRESSPSFSRWVGHPDDMTWHGNAVQATDAIRTAGFAAAAARLHGLDDVDVPLKEGWTTEPDNPWDHFFEEVLEYPETEEKYLSPSGEPTLLSRAWHQLLIGLNSDASGWAPWRPRTRHRNTAMQTSRSLANEIMARFARQAAARIKRPRTNVGSYVLALNPAPARTAEVWLTTEQPVVFQESNGASMPTAVSLQNGRWFARARIELLAYGYKLLGLSPGNDIDVTQWKEGSEIRHAGRTASLTGGMLTIGEGHDRVEVSVAPFKLSDPSGAAQTEDVVPTWKKAKTRTRRTKFGGDLELFTELAWTVWLRLVVSLREDRVEIAAEVLVDMPRRIGNPPTFDPEGLLLQFRGQAGAVFYDVPYATVQHVNDEASFVTTQRFVAMEAVASSFGLIALSGNQSFKVTGKEGIIAANLGASMRGFPDLRPECNLRPDGTAEHLFVSGGDVFTGTYVHRFALIFGNRTELASAARQLRTGVPLIRVVPGDGEWPTEKSLITIQPDTAHVTAFRVTPEAVEVVANDISGSGGEVSCNDKLADLAPYGVAMLRL